MLEDAIEAIENTGLSPGRDMVLAVAVASSHFHTAEGYGLDGRNLTSDPMTDQLEAWLGSFPIISFIDGLVEDDWKSWPQLRQRLGGKARIMGMIFSAQIRNESDERSVTTQQMLCSSK